MKRSIHLLIVLSFLAFLISGALTCKCIKDEDDGLYCGGELQESGGGSDCGWDIWQCRDGNAKWLNPCRFGCCGHIGKNSFCCVDNECSNCSTNKYISSAQNNQNDNNGDCNKGYDKILTATVIGAAIIIAALIIAIAVILKRENGDSCS